MHWALVRLCAIGALLALPGAAERASIDADYSAIFRDIHSLVAKEFIDPDMNGLDWNVLGDEFVSRLEAVRDVEQFASIVNQMLGRLNTSHTRLYTAREPEYFQLLSIFRQPLADQIRAAHPDNPDLRYASVGIFTKAIEGEIFITGVLEGAPGHRAGLRVGDRIISANDAPFHPIGSFEGRVGLETPMVVQRSQADPAESILTLSVKPELIQPAEMLLNAVNQSVRIIDRPNRRIGYIHMWSMAGDAYRNALREQVASGVLKDADALILDLRDGWGGANPEDLNMFHQRVPVMTHVARDGTQRVIDYQWRKPAALLVNAGTRSGKEIFAFGFQKYRIGPVIGTRTAGAVVGGRPYLIRPGILLYLAVADVRADSERLEGRGVTPDVVAPFDIRYANGSDPQLDAAISALQLD